MTQILQILENRSQIFQDSSLIIRKIDSMTDSEKLEVYDFIKKNNPKWKYDAENSFKLEKSSTSSYICRFSQKIIGVLNIKVLNNPHTSPWINQILVYPLFDPNFLKENPILLSDFFNSTELNLLFKNICHDIDVTFTSIGFFMLIVPLRDFCKPFIKQMSKSSWETHLNLADHYIQDRILPQNLLGSTYHLISENYCFKGESNIPDAIKIKMSRGITLHKQYLENVNPFCEGAMRRSFQKILETKIMYQNHVPSLQKKLNWYKKNRKRIWAKFLIFNQFNFAPYIHKLSFQQNFELFEQAGMRIRGFKTSSQMGRQVISIYRYPILMCFFECLVSEGSSFSEITNDKGNLRPEIFNPAILEKFLGEYFGILEINIATEEKIPEWIFAGLSFVKRKIENSHILSSTLLFPSWFRGYGFGQFLAMTAMFLCENAGIGKKFEVLGTSRNIMTNRLVEKLGFFRYGYLPNMSFDITGHGTSLSYAVGMNRTFRLSAKALSQLSKENLNRKFKNKVKKAYKINQKTFKFFQDELIKKKKINPLMM